MKHGGREKYIKSNQIYRTNVWEEKARKGRSEQRKETILDLNEKVFICGSLQNPSSTAQFARHSRKPLRSRLSFPMALSWISSFSTAR